MFGMLGTLGVVAQMAAMSLGYGVQLAMAFGLVACGAWIAHSLKNGDGWLLTTNAVVAGFAAWGLIQ